MNFYFEAAKTLDRLDAKQGSIKGVIGSLPEKDRKRTSALVIETLKYKSTLAEVIKQSKLLTEERKLTSMNLALVLVHDLLLAKGIQAGDGPIKQAVLRHKTRLNGEFTKLKIKRGAKSNADLAQSHDERALRIPRYVRVNTLLWSTDEAAKAFVSRGYVDIDPFENPKGFKRDAHVPDLLLFNPSARLQDDELYKSGKIILQDKASCFPALVLAPPSSEHARVIDATSAPGNKTSHLSALMKGKGKLHAFERDRKRFSTLKMMLSKASCRNVEPINDDFLSVSPEDPRYAGVTHILLDPSCSGSGIVNRLDHLLETEEDDADDRQERLAKLAAFQLSMIKHAMKFPSAKRIVYSTCSMHATENEHVVREALRSEEAANSGFRLASRQDVLPQWPRRGLPQEMDDPEDADSVIRCSPGEDATNGFFVSCFVKETKSSGKKRSAESLENEPSDSKPKKKKKKRLPQPRSG
ncbi:S-adenosyl-L-methionine-dependent methyltransferase [Punctularia strigosozonata HHB-11173 SS5]|uniref:S-adenosyl-L-methionine-dependent methyltransferase n=1 Tax=Punctularia strigosozonata (strain HHB-11173) TaxID=741275 RepID=R7S0E5_PUNST|nr:S-adenosyl-L-methionine-dependent methyltransferase [Punctularia strigosozonata HHB-11173 SS5]EIN03703.1 S-adenosyl-L-methionine-dependent methyltransferase [Punctularia strigosozonata HHB-11173 SS5]